MISGKIYFKLYSTKGSLVVGRWSADHLPTIYGPPFYGTACSRLPGDHMGVAYSKMGLTNDLYKVEKVAGLAVPTVHFMSPRTSLLALLTVALTWWLHDRSLTAYSNTYIFGAVDLPQNFTAKGIAWFWVVAFMGYSHDFTFFRVNVSCHFVAHVLRLFKLDCRVDVSLVEYYLNIIWIVFVLSTVQQVTQSSKIIWSWIGVDRSTHVFLQRSTKHVYGLWNCVQNV